MTGFPTANFSDSERGLFTPAEIQRLMRIEFDRAVRYRYPIALMLIEIDRLEYLHDLYGYESKEEIVQSLVSLLRSVTRTSDVFGTMVDNRLMALFPHTPGKAAGAIAGRLLRGSRGLRFQSDGRLLRATISVGIATLEQQSELGFQSFVEAAEEALRFALDAGGDRFVKREPATAVIDELREELEEQASALYEEHLRLDREAARRQDSPVALPTPATYAEPIPIEDLPEGSVGERIDAAFRSLGELTPPLEQVRNRIITLAEEAVQAARSESPSGREEKVDLLERRVAKLKDLLDTTEAELVRIARMKGVETGVASIYRSVQGLSLGENNYGRKKEMLTLLFEANVELRKKIDGSA